MAEARVEHSYPDAFAFLQAHDPESLAVLHDLLARAEMRDGRPVARRSVRDIAADVYLSKDTVHRRIEALLHAGVLTRLPSRDATSTYAVDLAGTGIALTRSAR